MWLCLLRSTESPCCVDETGTKWLAPAAHTHGALLPPFELAGRFAVKMAGNEGRTVRELAAAAGVLLLQVSWAAEDAMHRLKYTSQAEKVPGWSACDMLDPTVGDSTWFIAWCAQLAQAAGVLIVFSKTYRNKLETSLRSALRKEAGAILERKAEDPNFRIYVLDPDKGQSQGYAAMRGLLIDGKQFENADGWEKWFIKWTGKSRTPEVRIFACARMLPHPHPHPHIRPSGFRFLPIATPLLFAAPYR